MQTTKNPALSVDTCFIPVIVPVSDAECKDIQDGAKIWDIRKSVPFFGKQNLRARVLCCHKNGIIDTEYFCDSYMHIDLNAPPKGFMLAQFAKEAHMSEAALVKYAGKKKEFYAWHITNGRPLTALGKPCVKHIEDFGPARIPRTWKYSTFAVIERPESPAYRVTCDMSVPFGHEGLTTFLPAAQMDPDAEYCETKSLFEPVPAGYILLGRKDGFPFRGQHKWLVPSECAKLVGPELRRA